jgi:hypothetical protein
MTARHHHYLSQCYLKGFTKGRAKKSKLSVIDPKEKKSFETIPRNVGGMRDFNRIDVEGVDQNEIEKSLAEFEGRAATALKKVGETREFADENKDLILNLIAMIAVRSPERREHMRKSHADIADRITGLTLETKERWERQVAKLRDEDPSYENGTTYEDAKKFFESKEYEITVAREYHIHMEMVQIDAILPCLFNRNWLLIQANESSGPFITTDNPVGLSWQEPDKVPPVYRQSPGFGLKGTEVYFPVSQDLALLGEFEGKEGMIEATENLVAIFNSKILFNAYKQIYAPKFGFKFYGKGNEILTGNRIIRDLNA